MQNIGELLLKAQEEKGKSQKELRQEATKAYPKPDTGKPAREEPPRPNVGWLFFKDYYLKRENNGTRVFNRDLGEVKNLKSQLDNSQNRDEVERLKNQKKQFEKKIAHFFDEKNKVLKNLKPDGTTKKAFDLAAKQTLSFHTGDKGILIGTGIEHETGEQGEAKLGLQFDYATGQPYLPGSAVKGLMRSWFPGHRRPDGKNLGELYRSTRTKVLKKILREIWQKDEAALVIELTQRSCRWLRDPQANEAERFFEFLERQIFEGEMPDFDEKMGSVRRDTSGKSLLTRTPISRCDFFFDAYIVSGDKLLVEDVITPHRNPLQDPVPITFLKIAPGIMWQFQFGLQGCELMSANEKLTVFKLLLTHFGVGAKRRHGFGELIE